jgi:hypothetical protein
MGWVMFLIGLALPVPVGMFLIGKRRSNLALTLLSLVALPLVLWSASLYLKIGPCGVPDCMSSSEHSRLVLAVPGLVLLVAGYVLLAMRQTWAAGVVLILSYVLTAVGVAKTDRTVTVTLSILAGAAIAYLAYLYANRVDTTVPDYPPPA